MSDKEIPEIPEIIQKLQLWDDAYYNSDEELVSDAVYDVTRLQAFSLYPQNEYFKKVGSDVRSGKELLPYEMGSLDQVYEGQVDDYVQDKLMKNADQNSDDTLTIASDKLDGVSIMIVYRDSKLEKGYSRGNGIEGADITRHLRKMPSVPQTLNSGYSYQVVRGENIIKNKTFDDKYKGVKKTARAMVSGAMNAKVTEDSILDDIHFVLYEIVDTNEGQILSKEKQLEILKDDFLVVNYRKIKSSDINDKTLAETLSDAREKSEYEIDGLVITTEDINALDARKGSSLNPTHSIKYKKLPEGSYKETSVLKVHYNIGKSGFFTPRVEIEPVELFGTTVSFVTGHNAKIIQELGIGLGAKIIVTKSGQVIPYLVKATSPVTPDLPEGYGTVWNWNETETQAVVLDLDVHPTVKFERLLSFFNTLEINGLKEASLKEIIVQKYGSLDDMDSFDETLTLLLVTKREEWENLIGSNGEKIYDSLHKKLKNLDMQLFLGGLPHLGFGFGKRKAKKLIEQSDKNVFDLTSKDIENMEGFAKTSTVIVDGLPKLKKLWDDWKKLGIIEEKVKAEIGSKLSHINAVFTGVRDKSLQSLVESEGGKIGSGVSKNTTHVVAKDINGSSDKIKKAISLNVPLMTLDDFRKIVLDDLSNSLLLSNTSTEPKKKKIGLNP